MKVLQQNEISLGVCGMEQVTRIVISSDSHNVSAIPVAGVDPGQRNFGVACLLGETGVLFECHTESGITTTRDTVRVVRQSVEALIRLSGIKPIAGVIEQAAYLAPYGQVGLGEARIASLIALEACIGENGIILTTPPLTVRKAVFGSAKIKAQEAWPELEKFHNAAAALSCAMYYLVAPQKGKTDGGK